MNKPVTVRDRSGNLVVRQDGALLDGDSAVVPLMMTDTQRAIAHDGIVAALASREVASGKRGMSDAEFRAARDRVAGAYDGAARVMGDRWRAEPASPVGPLSARTEQQLRDVGLAGDPRARAHAEMTQRMGDAWKGAA